MTSFSKSGIIELKKNLTNKSRKEVKRNFRF
nr:MAG TPA: hypothetical protein [Caudoviricetes sp.]